MGVGAIPTTPSETRLGIRDYLVAVRRRPAAMAAHVLVLVVVISASAAPLYPIDPLEQQLMNALKPPSRVPAVTFGVEAAYPSYLGTDSLGRDLGARLLMATRVSLTVAMIAVAVASSIGVVLGLLAGYFGGVTDAVIMRIVDALLSLPFVVLAIAVVAAIGPGLVNVALVLGLTGWVTFAKLVRAEVLRTRESNYVEAARAVGCSHARILALHIAPQIVGIVLVSITLSAGQMIIAEAALSFLGLGIPLPTPTLGGILSEAQETFFAAWWIVVFPGVLLMVIVLSINLVGDFLRDFFDPKVRI